MVELDDWRAFPDRQYAPASVAEEGLSRPSVTIVEVPCLVSSFLGCSPWRRPLSRPSLRHPPQPAVIDAAPIRPYQYFFGEVNGQAGHATIKMGCFGPIYRGQHGHPLVGQIVKVLPAPAPTPRDLGFTGGAAHAIDVRFPTPTVAKVR